MTAPAIFLTTLFIDVITPVYAFAAGFVGSVFAFSITLAVLEYRERRGM